MTVEALDGDGNAYFTKTAGVHDPQTLGPVDVELDEERGESHEWARSFASPEVTCAKYVAVTLIYQGDGSLSFDTRCTRFQ